MLQMNLFSNSLDGPSLQVIDFGLPAQNFIISKGFKMKLNEATDNLDLSLVSLTMR